MKIALLIISTIAIYLGIRAYKLSLRILELEEQIIDQYARINVEGDVVRESFLKFVSDSREWAFEYIEEVQQGLNKFVKDVDSVIDYFDKYGEVIWTPLTPSMKTISSSYKELKKLLPEDDNDKI